MDFNCLNSLLLKYLLTKLIETYFCAALYLRSLNHLGRSGEAKDRKNKKKVKCEGRTDGWTDGRTDGRTDRWMDGWSDGATD